MDNFSYSLHPLSRQPDRILLFYPRSVYPHSFWSAQWNCSFPRVSWPGHAPAPVLLSAHRSLFPALWSDCGSQKSYIPSYYLPALFRCSPEFFRGPLWYFAPSHGDPVLFRCNNLPEAASDTPAAQSEKASPPCTVQKQPRSFCGEMFWSLQTIQKTSQKLSIIISLLLWG